MKDGSVKPLIGHRIPVSSFHTEHELTSYQLSRLTHNLVIWKAFAKITFLIWTLDFTNDNDISNNPGIIFRFFAMSFHFIWLCKHTIQDYSFAKILFNHRDRIQFRSQCENCTSRIYDSAIKYNCFYRSLTVWCICLQTFREAEIAQIEKRRMWLWRIEDLKSYFGHWSERARAASGNRISKRSCLGKSDPGQF